MTIQGCGPLAMQKEHSRTGPIIVAALLLLGLLAAYTAGYFLRGYPRDITLDANRPVKARIYPSAVEAAVFFPAAKVESVITGKRVLSRSLN
jgi:hypothetical protein